MYILTKTRDFVTCLFHLFQFVMFLEPNIFVMFLEPNIKMQPTDLTVAGCGVCMIYRAQMLPPGMGVPSY